MEKKKKTKRKTHVKMFTKNKFSLKKPILLPKRYEIQIIRSTLKKRMKILITKNQVNDLPTIKNQP